jgi:hypothetical protein
METSTFGGNVVAGDGPREESAFKRLFKLFSAQQHYGELHRVDFALTGFLHAPENAVSSLCHSKGWTEPDAHCIFRLLSVDFAPFHPSASVDVSQFYFKGSILNHQNDKNPRTFFKCSTSDDKGHHLDVPSVNSVINLRLKRRALPTSVDVAYILIPVSATLKGRGELKLPMFCSKSFPRTLSEVSESHYGILMCYVTVSFEHSFAAADGPAYDNEALPWQLRAIQSFSPKLRRATLPADSFHDGDGNMVVPGPPHPDYSVSAKITPISNTSVFHEFCATKKHLPIYIEFLRCRDLPKMDTFGTCDCFIECEGLSTECVKNTLCGPLHLTPSACSLLASCDFVVQESCILPVRQEHVFLVCESELFSCICHHLFLGPRCRRERRNRPNPSVL